MDDLISRQAAIDALWKALFEYEDKTEKQFLESDELDVYDWLRHRIFVQDMSDIDRKVIIDLPPAQPQYEELTPEEAASEIASGSIMAARYWLDDMMRLTKMGYAICRKR